MPKPMKFKVAKCDLEGTELVKQQILVIRGHRVMLDANLARLYGVTTKRLNQQLGRNGHRFPEDFAFRLTLDEAKEVAEYQAPAARFHRTRRPHAASVLNSKVAVQASIFVVRGFVQMRAALTEYGALSQRIDNLEATYDGRFQKVFEAIRALITIPAKPQHRIGFVGASVPKRRKGRQ